jgi:hypothetical protein
MLRGAFYSSAAIFDCWSAIYVCLFSQEILDDRNTASNSSTLDSRDSPADTSCCVNIGTLFDQNLIVLMSGFELDVAA